ncbi:MAG: ABC transporter ATP-binding protein [Anaerolineae bacterium]
MFGVLGRQRRGQDHVSPADQWRARADFRQHSRPWYGRSDRGRRCPQAGLASSPRRRLLYERLSARDNLKLFARLYDLPNADQRVDAMLSLFNLTERAKDRAGGFSKGMKQWLALARALVHDPQILFLDEPTAALDPRPLRTVMTLIETLSRESGRTVFLATHNLDEAQRLCLRVAVLSHGRLLALGTTAVGRQLWQALCSISTCAQAADRRPDRRAAGDRRRPRPASRRR